MSELGGCAEALAMLKNEIKQVETKNDHKDDVIKKNYGAFKSDELKPFAQPFHEGHRSIDVREDFRAKVVERLASHPYVRPTFDMVPSTNVQFKAANGSLKDRCHDMRQ